MKIETEIKQWGNSKAIRLSGVMAEIPHFTVGTKVVVTINEKGLTIQKATPKPKLRFSEKELITGLTPHLAHADELATLLPNEF